MCSEYSVNINPSLVPENEGKLDDQSTFYSIHWPPREGTSFSVKTPHKRSSHERQCQNARVFVYRVCSTISLSNPVGIQQSHTVFRPNVTRIIHATRLHTMSMIRRSGSEWRKLCQAIIVWVENIKVKHNFYVAPCRESLLAFMFALTSCHSRRWCPDSEHEQQWRRG